MTGSGHASAYDICISQDRSKVEIRDDFVDMKNKLDASVGEDGKSMFLNIKGTVADSDVVDCKNNWIFAGKYPTSYIGWSTHLAGTGKEGAAYAFNKANSWDTFLISGARFAYEGAVADNSLVLANARFVSDVPYKIYGGYNYKKLKLPTCKIT